MTSYNRVVIDLGALQANFLAIQAAVGPGVDVLAMVKSDAYGHGLLRSALSLVTVGATHFGVAEIDEGIALRQAGVSGSIVVFLGWDGADELIDYRLTPVVFDLGVLKRLSARAVARQVRIGVQLKVDVGMGRFGILPAEVPSFVAALGDLPGIYLAGILSHFPMADSDDGVTRAQNTIFVQVVDALRSQPGMKTGQVPSVHIANSAAVMACPESHHDLVRPGIALYGGYPADDAVCRSRLALAPVMSFLTRVLQLKEVPAGYGVSYGHLHVTTRSTRLAVLPVGYADGYLRSLTGHAQVLIRGQRAPVCGRICMNACVVDVSAIPEVSVGDEVVLLGRQEGPMGVGEITVDEIAGWMKTIHYEVMCLFGNSNQREYVGEMSEALIAG
ncbi:MAG: alanine racemase [Proteobacteria bacterium]|nr:alanine racemase [Desulfobulbaceae bacterium]MBU4152430.1 alanine racemase [Pseudomonadota bacterium]